MDWPWSIPAYHIGIGRYANLVVEDSSDNELILISSKQMKTEKQHRIGCPARWVLSNWSTLGSNLWWLGSNGPQRWLWWIERLRESKICRHRSDRPLPLVSNHTGKSLLVLKLQHLVNGSRSWLQTSFGREGKSVIWTSSLWGQLYDGWGYWASLAYWFPRNEDSSIRLQSWRSYR